MDFGIVAVIISTIGTLFVIGEKIFGGGNALANKFSKLELHTNQSVVDLRKELTLKVDQYEDNYAVGIDSIKANLHRIETGFLEFRAKMAEDYMHKRDYASGITDVRREVHDGFERVEKRLERMENRNNDNHK